MAYRRTANVVRRLNARHDAIVVAAQEAAAEGGMAGVQIVPVAERAAVASGTVYRYFPAKTDLVGALVEAVAEREIEAVRNAADAAPGPLSALVAAIAAFGTRALRPRHRGRPAPGRSARRGGRRGARRRPAGGAGRPARAGRGLRSGPHPRHRA